MNPGIPVKAIVAAAGLALLSLPAAADYEDGVNAALAGDYDTAFREFTIAAEEGLDLAQYNLGILCLGGPSDWMTSREGYNFFQAPNTNAIIRARARVMLEDAYPCRFLPSGATPVQGEDPGP